MPSPGQEKQKQPCGGASPQVASDRRQFSLEELGQAISNATLLESQDHARNDLIDLGARAVLLAHDKSRLGEQTFEARRGEIQILLEEILERRGLGEVASLTTKF